MSERMMLLLTITRRGEGSYIFNNLSKRGIAWNLRAIGHGTASSEMMDILGIGSREKDIIVSIAAKRSAEAFCAELEDNPHLGKGHGIIMAIPLNAINSLTAVMASRFADKITQQEVDKTMKNQYKHSLVLIAVNRGFADEVMTSARKAGATGGTVIKANLAENAAAELIGISLGEERDIVAIMVPDTIRDRMMEEINSELGMRTDAQAILCSVGVEKAMRI